MNLGEKLFELRKNKNLSQEEVAEKLNVTRQTVSKWETNQSTPDFDKIIPLCELFEISTDELLRGEKLDSKNTSSHKQEDKIETEENIKQEDSDSEKVMTRDEARKKMGEVTSTSILIYIVSIAVFIVAVSSTNMDSVIAVGLLIIACGYATVRIVKCCMSLPKFEELKEDKEKKEENQILKSIDCIIWCLITFIYFVISFSTMAWHITWLIFLIGTVITEIVKLVFLLKEGKNDEE